LIALASSLTRGVDFGKTPQTPTEQIIELVRVVAIEGILKGDRRHCHTGHLDLRSAWDPRPAAASDN
jgi:hypothetical protein